MNVKKNCNVCEPEILGSSFANHLRTVNNFLRTGEEKDTCKLLLNSTDLDTHRIPPVYGAILNE